RPASVLERHERTEGTHEAGQVVGNRRRARGDWRPVGEPAQIADAAHRRRDPPEPGSVGVGTGLAEGRDPDQDQPRVDGPKALPAEVPPLKGAGPEVFGEDVGPGRQALEQGLPLRRAKVARHRLLVPRLGKPPVREPWLRRAPEPPEVVADTRLLDLD